VTDINRALLGEPNAPCRTCGAPLAADQRYCLQCGSRRAEARLPFLDILARQVPVAAPAGVRAVETRRGALGVVQRFGTNAAAVAGVACLLLALGVGVLIGGIGKDNTAGGATPQVISVGSAAPPAAAPAATTATPDTATTPTDGASTPKTTKKKSSAASGASGSKATNKALGGLSTTSGKDYSKKSAKLPKTMGTGGAPPPVDKSKPVGGGTAVQSIG
jgi:hypothetical protein